MYPIHIVGSYFDTQKLALLRAEGFNIISDYLDPKSDLQSTPEEYWTTRFRNARDCEAMVIDASPEAKKNMPETYYLNFLPEIGAALANEAVVFYIGDPVNDLQNSPVNRHPLFIPLDDNEYTVRGTIELISNLSKIVDEVKVATEL